MSDIAEMTPDELRRFIAERLGYRLEVKVQGDDLVFTILSPDKHIIRQGRAKEQTPLTEALIWFNIPHWRIPDWPRDDGAAFMLCCDIAEEHNWHFEFAPGEVAFWEPEPFSVGLKTQIFSMPLDEERALALARLAARALESKADA